MLFPLVCKSRYIEDYCGDGELQRSVPNLHRSHYIQPRLGR
jgi:hypothetical protein